MRSKRTRGKTPKMQQLIKVTTCKFTCIDMSEGRFVYFKDVIQCDV